MSGTIKAIETRYKGCRFRSKLEARWAVWLDAMGITWQYEFQGFDLDGEAYLPDFWLPLSSGTEHPDGSPPVAGLWLEIKPAPLNEREERLLVALSQQTRHVAYAFAGDPWPGEFAFYKVHPARTKATDFRCGNSPAIFVPPTLCPECKGTGVDSLPGQREWEWRGVWYYTYPPRHCDTCGGGSPHPHVWFNFSLHDFVANVCRPYHEAEGGIDTVGLFTAACTAARSERFGQRETPK